MPSLINSANASIDSQRAVSRTSSATGSRLHNRAAGSQIDRVPSKPEAKANEALKRPGPIGQPNPTRQDNSVGRLPDALEQGKDNKRVKAPGANRPGNAAEANFSAGADLRARNPYRVETPARRNLDILA